ncbi:hypothetical protein SEA_COLUCCI_15 [Arthrobacter phage Colucci]|uniref:Tail terminator n=1 Tax=Arthrobacter phage Colucci TaxID=2015834 RepID=A0A286N2S9_9CAUD|nr:hypothetical protein FDI27_gp015 [Arthrobacter phage Colucci]ASX98686.1 hypothetical protein SEA_COLUCCI_15 [Arthrobacter phage Colucci]
MLGPEGVARALVYRLQERFPGKLAELRARLAIDAAELPELAALYAHEVDLRAVNEYPFLSVVELDTSGQLGNRQVDTDTDYDEYSYRYRMRVFVWSMASAHIETDLLRKRLALAVREVLLNDKILYDLNGQYAEVDPKTLKESFSGVSDIKDSQFLGAAYLEFEIVTQETLASFQGRVSDDPATIIPDYGTVGEGDTHPVPQPEP